jgi:type IV secretory pathway VirD2 relaxase
VEAPVTIRRLLISQHPATAQWRSSWANCDRASAQARGTARHEQSRARRGRLALQAVEEERTPALFRDSRRGAPRLRSAETGAMTKDRGEDDIAGKYGAWRGGGRSAGGDAFPGFSSALPPPRARAAWFNRNRGSGRIGLLTPRFAQTRRVIVKASLVSHAKGAAGGGGGRGRAGSGGAASLMRHALYVEREGAGASGGRVTLFNARDDDLDARGFIERARRDSHHFRFIVSPEDGAALTPLEVFARALMARAERDLATRLDWIAAAHHDTGRAHLHILVRGARADGRPLGPSRAYLSRGVRDAAETLATEILGPRRDDAIDRRAARTAAADRFTHLDRDLLARACAGEIRLFDLRGETRARLTQRLGRLEAWGLAEPTGPGAWRLARDLEDRLVKQGDERDRSRALAFILDRADRGSEGAPVRALEDVHSSQRVIGAVVGFERLGRDPRGPALLVVEGVGGQLWSARMARHEDMRALDGAERGAIVALRHDAAGLKPADRTIAEIAGGHEAIYSSALHRLARPDDRDLYLLALGRRLDALARAGVVARVGERGFRLPGDFAVQVERHEGRGGRRAAQIDLLDPHRIETQIDYLGPTWLDRLAFGPHEGARIAPGGLRADLLGALARRLERLAARGLVQMRDGGLQPRPGWRDDLRSIERAAIRAEAERETGRAARFAAPGDIVTGCVLRKFHGGEQIFALVADAASDRDAIARIVPWRRELDAARGRYVTGRVGDAGFTFWPDRERGRGAARGA